MACSRRTLETVVRLRSVRRRPSAFVRMTSNRQRSDPQIGPWSARKQLWFGTVRTELPSPLVSSTAPVPSASPRPLKSARGTLIFGADRFVVACLALATFFRAASTVVAHRSVVHRRFDCSVGLAFVLQRLTCLVNRVTVGAIDALLLSFSDSQLGRDRHRLPGVRTDPGTSCRKGCTLPASVSRARSSRYSGGI